MRRVPEDFELEGLEKLLVDSGVALVDSEMVVGSAGLLVDPEMVLDFELVLVVEVVELAFVVLNKGSRLKILCAAVSASLTVKTSKGASRLLSPFSRAS